MNLPHPTPYPIFRAHLADMQPEAKAAVPPACQSGLLKK